MSSSSPFHGMTPQPNRIRVLSFDFDGCLFHERYLFSDARDIYACNFDFFASINDENRHYSRVIGMIGSLRQSHYLEHLNATIKRESEDGTERTAGFCFPAFIEICDKLNIIPDKFLLADAYAEFPYDGAAFEAAEYARTSGSNFIHQDCIIDTGKLTVLYAQMHKIASENTGALIDYDFYDDRLDILDGLRDFFVINADKIPQNVRLRLHLYDGHSPVVHATVTGCGGIDMSFRESIAGIGRKTAIRELGPLGLKHLTREMPFDAPDSKTYVTADDFSKRQLYPGVVAQYPSFEPGLESVLSLAASSAPASSSPTRLPSFASFFSSTRKRSTPDSVSSDSEEKRRRDLTIFPAPEFFPGAKTHQPLPISTSL